MESKKNFYLVIRRDILELKCVQIRMIQERVSG